MVTFLLQVLHDYEHKTFDENVAKFQFFQIIDAVNHMHSLGICHRDLKLENILMKTKSRLTIFHDTVATVVSKLFWCANHLE
jgi:serine/threonine protein kinase